MDGMGISRNITNQSSQPFCTPSVYSSKNNIPSFGGHIDSSLLRQNQDPTFLLNRNESGGSSALSNQLLQQMNYKLHLQEHELALRKSQLERAGLNSLSSPLNNLSSPLGIGSFQNGTSSGLPSNHGLPSNFSFLPSPLNGNIDSDKKIAGRSESLKFANSSISGITPSRSTSVEKTPSGKFFYFPCRARGVDKGHDFDSAYFTIPDGLDHGADLYCSYKACRAEGCKFRYCASCKIPAARRNFRKRHGHGEISKDKVKNEEVVTCIAIKTSTHERCKEDAAEVVHESSVISETQKESHSDQDSCKGSKVLPRPNDSIDDVLSTDELNECWDKLLKSRPDAIEKSSMDAWMLKVNALSERMTRLKKRKTPE